MFVYGQLEKGSVCQHMMEVTGETLCGHEVPEHRLDKWEFHKGRGNYFGGRRICFRCMNVLVSRQSPRATMQLAESLAATGSMLRVVS